ncbi:MAG: VOC family protein [Cyanothece sp. SIO1E1]|nr:VOC family protein [Cyanothece sp. SIO1E1]
MIMGNPVVHFEIGCSDQSSVRSFYEACFDWKITSSNNMDEVDTNSNLGINGHITSLVTEIDHYVTFYIQVDNVEESLKKIEKEGGKTIVPPIKLPNGKTFAWFNDVAGNTLGIITN